MDVSRDTRSETSVGVLVAKLGRLIGDPLTDHSLLAVVCCALYELLSSTVVPTLRCMRCALSITLAVKSSPERCPSWASRTPVTQGCVHHNYA